MGASQVEQGVSRDSGEDGASSCLMLHPIPWLHATSLGPLSVSACQILVSMDSWMRFTLLTTIPQLRRRARHALLDGATIACALGSITILPRTNLVLGVLMSSLPYDFDCHDAIVNCYVTLETEMCQDAFHHRSKIYTYSATR